MAYTAVRLHTFEFFFDAVDSLLCLELLLLDFKNALAVQRGSLLLDLNHGIRDFRDLDFDPQTRWLGEGFDDTLVRGPRIVSRGLHGKFDPELVRIGDIFSNIRRDMYLLQNLKPAELSLQIQQRSFDPFFLPLFIDRNLRHLSKLLNLAIIVQKGLLTMRRIESVP